MFIVFSNSNWKKETFSLQNWLDPAKEIKKQIRSKFVMVLCLIQGVWKTSILVYPDPKNLHKKVSSSKLPSMCVKVLDPCGA